MPPSDVEVSANGCKGQSQICIKNIEGSTGVATTVYSKDEWLS